MDVVDAIAAMPNSGGQTGKAVDPVEMIRVTVSTATAARLRRRRPARLGGARCLSRLEPITQKERP